MKNFKVLWTGVLVACSISVLPLAHGAPIAINDLPTESSGPFQHNVFHSAASNGGESGTIFSWFSLDSGSWDPITGAFSLSVKLWDDAGHSVDEGTATATGNLTAGAFNGFDGGLIGTITWDFSDADDTNLSGSKTLSFVDINYVTSSGGYTANSTTGSFSSMTLWGADGDFDATTGVFDTGTTTVGMDMVATFVPVPAAVWLFGGGLAALIGVARRRRS